MYRGMTLALGPVGAQERVVPNGRIETVAGPGFCVGDAEPDRASIEVHAMAVHGDGTPYVDTGPVGDGVVGTVEPAGSAVALRPGVVPPKVSGVGQADIAFPPSQLAVDVSGEVLLTDGLAVVRYAAGPLTIAGPRGE